MLSLDCKDGPTSFFSDTCIHCKMATSPSMLRDVVIVEDGVHGMRVIGAFPCHSWTPCNSCFVFVAHGTCISSL